MERRRVLACAPALLAALLVALPDPSGAQTVVGAAARAAAGSAAAPAQVPARADPAPIPDAAAPEGRVTGYPVPRFVTLKRDRARARRGPGEHWRVDWEFVARGMPLEVVAEYGNWRRVRDIDGHGGWVHHIFLDGGRSAIVTRDMAALRAQPDAGAAVRARIEAGAILKLERCEGGWCRIDAGDAEGWLESAALWGARPGESFD